MQQLSIKINGHSADFHFGWTPLVHNQASSYVWDYYTARKGDKDLPVIYRHILDVPQVGIVTIYVGEGSSLNGPSKYNLRYQYSNGGHGATRVKVRNYIASRNEKGWTEILNLKKPVVNFSDNRERKLVQMAFIAVYYWEHQRLLTQGYNIPDFLNEPA